MNNGIWNGVMVPTTSVSELAGSGSNDPAPVMAPPKMRGRIVA